MVLCLALCTDLWLSPLLSTLLARQVSILQQALVASKHAPMGPQVENIPKNKEALFLGPEHALLHVTCTVTLIKAHC